MATVVVTGVGGAGGIGAVRSLRAETSHEIIGVDMNPSAAGLQLADRGCVVPPANDPSWAEEVGRTVRRFDADAVVPLVDEELRRVSDLSDALPGEVAVVAPRREVIDVALDKFRASRYLDDRGHTVPETWLATGADSIDRTRYPLQVKPRAGRGSRGVERVDSPAELAAYLDATEHARDRLVLQEHVSGTEYTTSVVAARDGRVLGIVPKEAVEKDGSTVHGVTRRNEAVAESCRRLCDTLEPAGPINVQQIVDGTGTPYTIEINPRFSSTACLTVRAGVNELDLLVRDAMGETVAEPDGYEAGVSMYRYPDHVFVSDAERDRVDRSELAVER
jgi:carbamoyl-phosphate synthase large subunit